jgi:hypothetical protein
MTDTRTDGSVPTQSVDDLSGFSLEPPLQPAEPPENDATQRIVNYVQFYFKARQRFEKRLVCGPNVRSGSRVFVSICEVNAQYKPFQGGASMEVHNVVPHDDGIVIVRGFIGWDNEINVRLSVLNVR